MTCVQWNIDRENVRRPWSHHKKYADNFDSDGFWLVWYIESILVRHWSSIVLLLISMVYMEHTKELQYVWYMEYRPLKYNVVNGRVDVIMLPIMQPIKLQHLQ